jgi:hypothetical protein
VRKGQIVACNETALADHIHWLWFDCVGGEGRDPTLDELRATLSEHPDFANCDPEMVERRLAAAVAEWREIDKQAMDHDCEEHLKYRECCYAENLDPDVDGAIDRWHEEWWECAVCGETFTDQELKTTFGKENTMQTQATSVGDSASQPSTCAPATALKRNTRSDPMNGSDRLETTSELWDQFGQLWDELDITRLLEQHIPLQRRYLVDRLRRIQVEIESRMRRACISS